MRIINTEPLRKFEQQHGRPARSLQHWQATVEAAHWRHFADLRETFGSADNVKVEGKTVVVFNISGNKYRLVATVDYKADLVIIKKVMTHAEYTKRRWKNEIWPE